MKLMSNLARIKGTAKDLVDPRIGGVPIRLRLQCDSDDPATWHPVRVVNDQWFRDGTTGPSIKALTVEFHDGTPEVVLNDDDDVEFAIPPPIILDEN